LVRELQESLYRRWGLISPLALPPLLPLRFAAGLPEEPASALPAVPAIRRRAEDLHARLRGERAPRAPRLRTAGLEVRQGALFWELTGDTAPLRELVAAVSPWSSMEPPPFPPIDGFFLALAEPGTDLARAAAALAAPPPSEFPAGALVLLAVRPVTPEPLPPRTDPPPAPPWYRALEWEEVVRVALKKPQQSG
jgi:hypothetical protein